MNAWFNVINTALFHSVSTPFFVLAAVCVTVVAVTIALAVYELKHDLS